jgi:VCBS repeat-containing protein
MANPIANNDGVYGVANGRSLTVSSDMGVLANDFDADHDTLSAIKLSDPAHGTVTLNADGAFTYTPTAGYTGTDSFICKVNDGSTDSATATVGLNVAAGSPFPNIDLPSLTLAQGFIIQGDADHDQAGYSVASAGDVNGEGYADLIERGAAAGRAQRADRRQRLRLRPLPRQQSGRCRSRHRSDLAFPEHWLARRSQRRCGSEHQPARSPQHARLAQRPRSVARFRHGGISLSQSGRRGGARRSADAFPLHQPARRALGAR